MLAQHLEGGHHVWIDAQRRYGKTSLIRKTVDDLAAMSRWVSARCSFTMAADLAGVCRPLLRAIWDATLAMQPDDSDQTIRKLKRQFEQFRPTVTLGSSGFNVRFEAVDDRHADFPLMVQTALEELENSASVTRHDVVLLLDEFQAVGELNQGHTLEWSLREFAQTSKRVRFIFAGSEPTLMRAVFGNEKRALYHLCRKMELRRIAAPDYVAHFAKAARNRWNKKVSAEIVDRVLELTDRHPYYVNVLAQRLWERSTPPATGEEVDREWAELVGEERGLAEHTLGQLPSTQKKFVLGMFKASGYTPRSKEFLHAAGLASSSSSGAGTALAARGIIEFDADSGLPRLLDPVIAQLVRDLVEDNTA